MSQKYAVIFEQAESNWEAYVPDLPGCITTGKTLEETERNIREAIQGPLLDRPSANSMKNSVKHRYHKRVGLADKSGSALPIA